MKNIVIPAKAGIQWPASAGHKDNKAGALARAHVFWIPDLRSPAARLSGMTWSFL